MKRFFGWLFLTDVYMATLTDEQVALRALGGARFKVYEQARRLRNVERALRRHGWLR